METSSLIFSARASLVVNAALLDLGRDRGLALALGPRQRRGEGGRHLGRLEAHAGLGGDDLRPAVDQGDRGVLRSAAVGGDDLVHQTEQGLLLDVQPERAVAGPQRQRGDEVAGLQTDPAVAEDKGHRGRDGRVGDVVHRGADVGVVDVGRRGHAFDDGGGVVGEVRRQDRLARLRRVDRPADLGLVDTHAGALEADPPVPSRGADALGQPGQVVGHRHLRDRHQRAELLAAGVVVPQPRRVPAAAGAGLAYRPDVVHAEPQLGRGRGDLLPVDVDGDRCFGARGQAWRRAAAASTSVRPPT